MELIGEEICFFLGHRQKREIKEEERAY